MFSTRATRLSSSLRLSGFLSISAFHVTLHPRQCVPKNNGDFHRFLREKRTAFRFLLKNDGPGLVILVRKASSMAGTAATAKREVAESSFDFLHYSIVDTFSRCV